MPLTFESQDKNGLVTTSKKGLASFFKLSIVVKKIIVFSLIESF